MFSGWMMNYYKKHPLKNATLVDYGIVQCQMPVIGVGTFIGSQLNTVLPDLIVLLFLMALLVVIAAGAILKCLELLKKENELLNLKKSKGANTIQARINHVNLYLTNLDKHSKFPRALIREGQAPRSG